MFLVCTAEHSVLWEALCKSLSSYTVNSIASSDSSKVLNVVVKPITKADLSQQKQTLESAQVALVTFPPEFQLAAALCSNEEFTLQVVINNLKATHLLAESELVDHVFSVDNLASDLCSSDAGKAIAHYFSDIQTPDFFVRAIDSAKSILKLEPEIKSLYSQVKQLFVTGRDAQPYADSSHKDAANLLIESMRELYQSKEESQILIEQLTRTQIEVAKLTSLKRAKEASLEQDISVLTSQLFVLQHQLEIGGGLTSSNKSKDIAAQAARNNELKLENEKLNAKLKRKSQAEKQLRLQVAELRSIKQSPSWKVSKSIDKLNAKVSRNAKQRRELLENVALVYSSDYFDADWYLSTYKDVKESGVDPAEHYLVFGAKEGRRPSTEFDGDWYLKRNTDVAKSGMNPLLHFLKYGKDEKRAPNRFSSF
ncbi:hypothetical protein [Candidatus Enterovibrio escicola]|uniref:hypothetical protein n=1 Tax=Candidatus Enterovibrio escicola TaxID=1927127 RepID=UPI0012382DE1|nr:hypothetical protein [Candidatus Enterovibrio escacola]